MAKQEKYIQVGVTAMRDPATGEFLPAVPLYIKAEDGAEAGEEKLIEDIGKLLAEKAVAQGITEVVFDRGGYIYHGRIKELADGAREAGLNF